MGSYIASGGFRMKIGLEIVTDMNVLAKEIQKEIDAETLKHLIKVLSVGVEKVRKKMEGVPYQDHTGNLNSSTGFIIYHNGQVVHRDFRESDKGTDKVTGLKEGLSLALAELRESSGWGVVLMSGMDYASWVQGKGYDVLLSATTNLNSILKEAFNEIGTIE